MEDKILEEEELLESNNDIYKCPGCGANLKYDSSTKGLHCEYCGYEFKIDGKVSSEENDFSKVDLKQTWDKEVHKAVCKNCGANIILDQNDITKDCPFCSTPLVLSTDELVGLKPDRVIPFSISQETGIENYRKWIKKRFFAPAKVKKDIPNPLLYSVYIPSWTYDSDTITSYKGRLGRRYTKTVGSGKNRRTVTYVKYFRISGIEQIKFDDVLICSGKKINQDELSKIQPFNTNSSFEFDNRYIVGHTTEHYSLELKDGWNNATQIMENYIRSSILSRYHYDVVDYLKLNTSHNKITYKYVVLPIWICHYTFHKRKYRFLVNGETGKVVGKYPKSILRISFVVILAIAAIILLFYLMMS